MKPKVYIETSIVGYLTGRTPANPVVAEHQRLTRHWWRKVLPLCSPHISPLVEAEVSRGDPLCARARMNAIKGMPSLDITAHVQTLAESYHAKLVLPEKARSDSLHLAFATVHGIDYLLTWNCAHLASVRVRLIVASINERLGLDSPIICTPEQLMEV